MRYVAGAMAVLWISPLRFALRLDSAFGMTIAGYADAFLFSWQNLPAEVSPEAGLPISVIGCFKISQIMGAGRDVFKSLLLKLSQLRFSAVYGNFLSVRSL